MAVNDPRSDEQLLAAARADREAFAAFYRRHLGLVVGFFQARVGEPELAADLAAETFAAALLSSGRYRPERGSARAWLFAIAGHKLVDSLRRGRVEATARRRLGMAPIEIYDADIERVEELAASAALGDAAMELLADLPKEVRAALGARVVDERPYADIAQQLQCSEAVVRKRVSRGLARLRARLEDGG